MGIEIVLEKPMRRFFLLVNLHITTKKYSKVHLWRNLYFYELLLQNFKSLIIIPPFPPPGFIYKMRLLFELYITYQTSFLKSDPLISERKTTFDFVNLSCVFVEVLKHLIRMILICYFSCKQVCYSNDLSCLLLMKIYMSFVTILILLNDFSFQVRMFYF